MKKIALTLLSLFLITPCLANIHINPSTVEFVIKEFVPIDKIISVVSEYNNQLKQSNGTGISAQNLWNICAIAGWDIKQPSGKSQCQKFVKALVKNASIKFYHACDKDYKGKTGYICVDDFFTNKIYGGTQVNLTPGQTLAKEYARLKHSDSMVQCEANFNKSILDYRLMCTSHNQNIHYEFVFDDLEEPKDQTIKNSIQNAICRMYDAKPTTAGCAGGGTNVSGTTTCWSASCAADNAKCVKINQSMAKFGYGATYKDNKCEINFDTVSKREDLKTAYGIDNFVFCYGIQVTNAPNVETYLKQYVAERAGVSTSSVVCDSGFNTYTGTGCAQNGITDFKDDIKTCRVGNNQIDFVFDDINEKWKKIVEGGTQGISCIVTGGTYSGKRCIGLGEQQCNVLRQSNLTQCPECKAAKWDPDTESCILPSSASVQNLQRGINIALITGGAVVGVALTVATAGTIGAPVMAIVLTGIETIGAGVEISSQLKINGITDDFLVESNKCKSASCAEKLIKQNLQRLSNFANDMQTSERNATDKELARLIDLLPVDSQLLIDIIGGDSLTDANQKSLFDIDSWEQEQIWRAVGIALQMTSVFTAVGKWILTKAGLLAETLPEASIKLTTKAKISRTELQNAVNEGKEIKTSNGKKLVVQLFRRSEEIAETEIRIEKMLDDIFGQKITEISRLNSNQRNIEQNFIARNKGMLFHASATDYKDGAVQALSRAWQIHAYPDVDGLLFADADFYTVKPYASNGIRSASVKSYTNTTLRISVPKKYADKFKEITDSGTIILSDRPRQYGYVYAVKPDDFKSAGISTHMMATHDVERIDRITIPLDTEIIFVREGALRDLINEQRNYRGFIHEMNQAAWDIDNGKNVLKNLQIYEKGLEKLADIIQ